MAEGFVDKQFPCFTYHEIEKLKKCTNTIDACRSQLKNPPHPRLKVTTPIITPFIPPPSPPFPSRKVPTSPPYNFASQAQTSQNSIVPPYQMPYQLIS